MGILTDTFIASEAEIASTAPLAEGPLTRFPTVQAKGIDSVKLATLAAILAGDDLAHDPPDVQAFVAGFVAGIERDFPLVRDLGAPGDAGDLSEGSSRGPWIFRIPDTMTTRLARLSRAEMTRCGRRWAATEEWQLAKAPSAGTVVKYLRRLCQLARRAGDPEQHMYLWIAL